jgi:hypothetical protein
VVEITAEQTGKDAHIGFGANDKAFFWIGTGVKRGGATHVACGLPLGRALVALFGSRRPFIDRRGWLLEIGHLRCLLQLGRAGDGIEAA